VKPSTRQRRTAKELACDGTVALALAGLGVLLILVSLGKMP
jgi:hypothetical protein